MAQTVLASGSRQDISGGTAPGSPEAAPTQKLSPPETRRPESKRRVFRGFSSALGSLARALSLGETDPEPDNTEPQPPSPPPSSPSIAQEVSGVAMPPFPNGKIKIKPGPQLNAIRSDLQNLLTELHRDQPDTAAPPSEAHSSAGPDTEPQVFFHEPSVSSQLKFLEEALSSQADLPSAEPSAVDPAQEPGLSATSPASETGQIESAPVAAGQYAILSGKTIAVVGFPPAHSMALGQALAAQHCSFLTLTHTDAEFRKGAITGCDALILNVRPESVQTGSGEVSSLLATKKPVLLVGDADALISAAMLAQNNPREFVAASNPALTRETIWRTALLLSALPGPKARARKKNRQIQIVIGDDDPSSRTLVHAILAQEGMKCHAADNGAHALALARSKGADVLIVDVNMPGLDGFQVLAEIKRDASLAAMRVILLTTRQAESDVLRGFGLGADDYVTKPFSPLELAARVKRLLGRKI
jgi:CheY-like chemotaxis protein